MPQLLNFGAIGLTVVEEDHRSAVPAFKHFLRYTLTYVRETLRHNRGRKVELPDRRLNSAAFGDMRV